MARHENKCDVEGAVHGDGIVLSKASHHYSCTDGAINNLEITITKNQKVCEKTMGSRPAAFCALKSQRCH
jgi:hypothetical protein